MEINRDNIKIMLGETSTTYDNQIDLIIPQLLSYITQFCKNDFILYGANGYVYDTVSMTITSTTITLSTDLPIEADDFIRLYGTAYNDDLYQVESYSGGVITIKSAKTLKAETVNGTIALIEFPDETLSMISKAVNDNVIVDSSIESEKIDDTSIKYSSIDRQEFVNQNKYVLLNYRRAFKQEWNNIQGCFT